MSIAEREHPIVGERVRVRAIRSRHAKKLVRESVHHDLHVVIIGTSPASCAIARALGRSAFAHVTLLTDGEQLATYSYVDTALFEKAFAFVRASAFPGNGRELVITRAPVRLSRKITVRTEKIDHIDPKKRIVHMTDRSVITYDTLLIPHDENLCALENRNAEVHQYISSGDDVMALHTFFAARVEYTPKRDPIDIVCDTSVRTGRELLVAIERQLPEFAARYGHPRETIHIHDVAHIAHDPIAQHEVHVHFHAKERRFGVTVGELLAHAGHIILPAFGSGLSGVDLVHTILAHVSIHPLRSERFDEHLAEEYYIAPYSARRGKHESVVIYVMLRVKDLGRAIRAYGLVSGIRAWRGLKI